MNETWNTCPSCNAYWETFPPIDGLIHRTILCVDCIKKNNEKHFDKSIKCKYCQRHFNTEKELTIHNRLRHKVVH